MSLKNLLGDIPFNIPFVPSSASSLIASVLSSGKFSGNGPFSKACADWLEKETLCAKALLTPSCTAALEMSTLLSGIVPGDEVLVPSFTFVSTANAFTIFGAKPIFVDVDPQTLNIDPNSAKERITSRTRAIAIVHYAGIACDMEAIWRLARDHSLVILEDNAHGLCGFYKDRPLGSVGDVSSLSFHETKNFSCGEGGAVLVNRPEWTERAQIIQDKGTNRAKFLQGQTDKYTWVDHGSSYLLGELPAALLLSAFQNRMESQKTRLKIWSRYQTELSDWGAQHGVRLPSVPSYATHPGHLFYLQFPEKQSQRAFIAALKDKGITAPFHYQALNSCPMGLRLGGQIGSCPVAELASETLVRLPLYATLKSEEQTRVLDSILEFHP